MERRCWACGSKEHFAGQCPRCGETKPKAAKANTKSPEKEKTQASSSKEDKKKEDKEEADCHEATKMLKTMEGNEAVEKRAKASRSEDKMELLQKQLEGLKASLKPFRLSKICDVSAKGLLDSGATHPLRARRPGEVVDHLPSVKVTLAGDKENDMKLTETGVILGAPGTEPIVPMGLLLQAP